MATNNFLNMVGDHARLGRAVALQRRAPPRARPHHARLRRHRRSRRACYVAQRRAGVPRALQPLAVHAQRLPHPHRGPGARAVPRAGAARLQSSFARRRPAGRRLRAALHPLPRLQAVTASTGPLRRLVAADERDPDLRQAATRSARSSRHARRCRKDTSSASSRKAPSAAPATCCRSNAASSGSSTASTSRSSRSISIASGAASSASKAAASSGSGRCAFPIR